MHKNASRMAGRNKIIIGVLVVANIALAGYVLAGRYAPRAMWSPSKLRPVVDSKRAYSSALLLETLKLMNDQGQLEEIHSITRHSHSGTAVVVLFSSVCTGCQTGQLVNILNASAKRDNGPEHFAILPDTFSLTDLNNFKTNLEVSFSVELADAQFSREWLSLNKQYGEQAVNGTVLVVSNGRIISVTNGLDDARRLLDGLGKSDARP